MRSSDATHGLRSVPGVITLGILILHMILFGFLDHGHRSHHEPLQIISLLSLLIWFPFLVWHLRQFSWPEGSRMWLGGFAAWSLFLLSTALFTFLPGILERWKFTNALVSHTHIAMAGMLTSFNMLILVGLNQRSRLSRVFACRKPFLLWQIGCAVLVVTLLVLGEIEAGNPGLLYRSARLTDAFYVIRFIAGGVMLIASASWLASIRLALRESV